MAVSKFGSLHAGMLTRQNMQGETPAASKGKGHRSSIGPLMDVQPEPVEDPATDASDVGSGSQFEPPDVDISPPREVVEPEPYDRGFGRRRSIEKRTEPGLPPLTASDPDQFEEAGPSPAEDEAPYIADDAADPDHAAPTAEDDEDIVLPDAVSEPALDPAEQPAPWAGWRRAIDKSKNNRDVEADITADIPPATPETPSVLPEQNAGPGEPPAGDITQAVTAAEEPPLSAVMDASDIIDPAADDADAAPHEPPADINAAIEKAIRKVPILTAADQGGPGRKRKKLTLRIDSPTYHRLRQVCAEEGCTQQSILESALLNYLDDFGPETDEAEDGP